MFASGAFSGDPASSDCSWRAKRPATRLRNNPHVLQEGHEIRVTVPPRNEMPMEVAGKPRPRGPAEVESDVKAVRAQHAAVKIRHRPQLVLAAQKLGVAQLVQRPFMGQGCNEQVAVVVGKAVEHDEGLRRTTRFSASRSG